MLSAVTRACCRVADTSEWASFTTTTAATLAATEGVMFTLGALEVAPTGFQ